ncbi:hypothetical protein BD626DRAFT_404124 [Schizophyllum amplum]|uniref:Transcription factor TFIIIC triple barrel domain-containing protein n=1 Tax=Schizophyllum amplum TaxID=97359 RepID=A0A550CC82_9AGAR|nr:hypothetical protein BD626DRAFT_404124 [Auriculariopsis ampla]
MSQGHTLCPGYAQVDSFGPDEDYDGEEATSYVTLDLGGTEPTLVPSSSSYRLIGLDSPTPFLQLSGTILKGAHDSLLGTELVFAGSDGTRPASHLATTSQRISFRAVQLHRKGDGATAIHAKGKGRGDGVIDLTDSQALERMTGKLPKERRKRGPPKGRKSGFVKAEIDAGDMDVDDASAGQSTAKVPARRTSTRGKGRGKGKARAGASDDDWEVDD